MSTRCKQCRHILPKTIAFNGCRLHPGKKHPLNLACGDFEAKSAPVKIEPEKLDNW